MYRHYRMVLGGRFNFGVNRSIAQRVTAGLQVGITTGFTHTSRSPYQTLRSIQGFARVCLSYQINEWESDNNTGL